MAHHSYDLLSVESVSDGARPYRATGTLADQAVDPCDKWPAAMWVAGTLARLRRGRKLKLVGVEFDVDTDAMIMTCRATGPLGRLVQRELDKLAARLASCERPFAVREDALVYTLYQPPVPSLRFINSMSRIVMQSRRPVKPTTCTLQITARCQLNCYHCSAARYRTPMRQELSTDELKLLIRQAEALGVFNIVFTGGEPLLRKDLCELISFVNRDRAHASIFTNGLLLTPENAAKLADAGLYSAMVSIDDPRPEVHEGLRCILGGFNKSIEGVRNLRDAGVLVGVSSYAGPEDLREGRVEAMIELARDIGAHEITIFDIVPTGKLLPLQADQILSDGDKERIIEIERHYNSLEDYPHVVTQAFVNGPRGAGCFAGFTQFYMTAYGDIDPCDFTPLTFGNVRDEPLADIWARMLAHPAYQHRCDHCRMQDAEFRASYIDDIPDDVLLPWPAYDELRDRPNGPPQMTLQEARTPGLVGRSARRASS